MDLPSSARATRGAAPGDTDATAAPPDDLRTHVADLQVTLDAQRELLRARRPTDLVDTLRSVVHRAGATVVDGEVTGPEVLQIDIGLGVRPPSLPWSPPDHTSRPRLQRLLPGLVDDAARIAHRMLLAREQGDASLRDELTGALSEDATRRLLGKLHPGDAALVCTLPEATAAARDELTLRALAELVRSELDIDERLCRLDATSLAVAIPHADRHRLDALADRIAERWSRERQEPLLLGSAIVTEQHPDLARTLLDRLHDARTPTPHRPEPTTDAGVQVRFRHDA